MSYKESIIKLRKQGKTYREIQVALGCSKGTISYHCAKLKYNQELINKNTEVLKTPTPSLNHEDTIAYLVKTGNSRKIIADALKINYDELVLFCKRRGYKSDKNFKGYAKIKQHRRNKKILAVLYLGGKCSCCGYNKSYSALDFHHINPEEKEFTIAKNTSLSWKKMKAEIQKCILLCANCHREEHDHWI